MCAFLVTPIDELLRRSMSSKLLFKQRLMRSPNYKFSVSINRVAFQITYYIYSDDSLYFPPLGDKFFFFDKKEKPKTSNKRGKCGNINCYTKNLT